MSRAIHKMCSSIAQAIRLGEAWLASGCNVKEGGRKAQVMGCPLIGEQFGHKAGSLAKW